MFVWDILLHVILICPIPDGAVSGHPVQVASGQWSCGKPLRALLWIASSSAGLSWWACQGPRGAGPWSGEDGCGLQRRQGTDGTSK